MLDKLKMIGQAREIQNKLKSMSLTEERDGITITINGNQEILDLKIDESLLSDKAELEAKIKNCFNSAVQRSQREMAEQMKGEMGGLFGM